MYLDLISTKYMSRHKGESEWYIYLRFKYGQLIYNILFLYQELTLSS